MTPRAMLIVAIVFATQGSPVAAGDGRWAQFRGPGSRGISDEAGLPTSWSTTENVAWSTDIPGLGWSSPILWDDTVFLTTVVSAESVETPKSGLYFGGERPAPVAEHRWLVYVIDVESGTVTCDSELHSGDAAVLIDADLQDPPELIPRAGH